MKRLAHHTLKCTAIAGSQMRHLNLEEYAAKDLLREYGCKTEVGYLAKNAAEALSAAQRICTPKIVVKSQIDAGGRGKGHFTNGLQGGVKIAQSVPAAVELAEQMLGGTLITKQTGPHGKKVTKVLLTEVVPVKKEFYVALLLDRKTCCPTFIGSAEGGTSIEDVAAARPDAIKRLLIDVAEGFNNETAYKFAQELGFVYPQKAVEQLSGMYNLAKQKDCTLVEVNPMVEVANDDVLCIDAKITVDDNAEFRQEKLWKEYQDLSQLDPREIEAHKYDINYVALDGCVGCIVNGAGLGMATMDMVNYFGCAPANFLDTGGNSTAAQIAKAISIILSGGGIKCIFVNIFGGITHCDKIAHGVVDALKSLGPSFTTPVVIRLQGTREEEGRKIIFEAQKTYGSTELQYTNDSLEAAELVKKICAKTK